MAEIDHRLSVVVCDAGPLIHLDELACLDLLADFQDVLVPDQVWREVQRHRPSVFNQSTVTLRMVSPTRPLPPMLEAMARLLALHTGEVEALRVALEHPSTLLLTDDTASPPGGSQSRNPSAWNPWHLAPRHPTTPTLERHNPGGAAGFTSTIYVAPQAQPVG